MKKRMVQIGVVGCYASDKDRIDESHKIARELGQEIAARNAVLIFDLEDYLESSFSLVERAVNGAREQGGMVLAMGDSLQAQFPTLVINAGNGERRECTLALSCDAILVVGGDVRRTLRIMSIASQTGRPVIPIAGTGGWSGRHEALRDALRDASCTREFLTSRPTSPKEAVKWALDMMKYKPEQE